MKSALLLLLLGVYVASLTQYWFHTSDSALYLMLGKNIEQGEGYTLWGYPHVHVPPGFPALIATLSRLGIDSAFGLNTVMLLMGLATLAVAYFALKETEGRETAFLVVIVILAFSNAMHRGSVRLLSDVPFMLLVWIGILGYTRGLRRRGIWLELGTLALLACPWVRVVGIPLAGAAVIGLLLQPREIGRLRVWANALVLALGTIGTGMLFYLVHQHYSRSFDLPSYASFVGRVSNRSSWIAFWQPVENFLATGGQFSEVISGQPHKSLGWLVGILWIPVLIGMWQAARRRQFVGLFVCVGYLTPILVLRIMLPRYLLPVGPLLTLYLLSGVVWIVQRRGRWKTAGPRVAMVLGMLLLVMNLHKCASLIYRLQVTRSVSVNGAPALVQETADYLHENARSGDRFISAICERQIALLSHVPSVPSVSRHLERGRVDSQSLQFWIDRGVRFVISSPRVKEVNRKRIEAVCKEKNFELVFSNTTYQLYALRPLGSTARRVEGVSR